MEHTTFVIECRPGEETDWVPLEVVETKAVAITLYTHYILTIPTQWVRLVEQTRSVLSITNRRQ